MNGPFEKHGLALISNGHGIVPIPAGGKAPALKIGKGENAKSFAWQTDYARTPEQFEVMLSLGWGKHGVGIVTKSTPAIDIDVLDEDVVQHMLDWIDKHIATLPQRVGKAPKTLLIFSTGQPFSKITSNGYEDPTHPEWTPKSRWMRIEMLGDGQQFVAFGIHPDTDQPYQWIDPSESPLTNHVIDLPTLDGDQLHAICREFERHVEALGWVKKSSGSSSSATSGSGDGDYDSLADIPPPSESTHEVERVKSALASIRPHISDYSYEQWLELMFALKWTQWDCAEELAREISEASDKHTDEHFERTWRGAEKKTQRSRKVTLASLYASAKGHGWDATRIKTEEQEVEDFEKIMKMAAKLTGQDQDVQVRLLPRIFSETVDLNLTNTNQGRLLKFICSVTKLPMADLRKDLAAAKKDNGEMGTHAAYAKALIRNLKKDSGVMPVGVEGQIFQFDDDECVWRGKLSSDFAVDVAAEFDGRENCTRRTDYTAIAAQAYAAVSQGNAEFFNDAPVGLACRSRFYQVTKGGEIVREPLSHEHRQRVAFDIRPVVGPMPDFTRFLHDAFDGNAEEEQTKLLQEVVGATVLGIFANYEKVLLMKGPGRAGKGTMLKIIESLIPVEARSAVSPFKWDSEYYLANLAGKRLNVVGELPDDEAIPAAAFKTVTGRDTLTGRHPTHRPFNFRNQAAHIFNGNHFIFTKDHSEAFYTRWLLMEFKNSRIGRENEQETDLAQRIIDNERPAILAWALQGAKRLVDRGHFETTTVQLKLMAQWQRRSSTLMEFLFDTDVCTRGQGVKFVTARAFFYKTYSEWCRGSNRKPMGKQRLYDEIESPTIAGLGIRFGSMGNGSDAVRGIYIRAADDDVFDVDDGEL